MSGDLPPAADVVVVGAGILGCSIAWHIVRRRAETRVLVVERQPAVATQASAQAAGLMTRARADVAVMALVGRTYGAMEALADELDQPPPLNRTGTVHVASSESSVGALEALVRGAAEAGLRVERPGGADLAELVAWLDPEQVGDCAFMPDDAFVDPYLLADGYARAARRRWARFRFGVEVRAIRAERGRVAGLVTAAGEVQAPVVVLACAAWANRLTVPLGFGLAMAPVRSHYWLSEPDPLFPRAHPAVIMPDARAYTRPELGGLLFGLRETAGVSIDPRDLPADAGAYAFTEDPDGWRSLEEGVPALGRYCPAIDRATIRRYVAGASTYTPDGLFLAGAVPAVDGLFAASGCCGAGVAASGGLGEALAALALGEAPGLDLAGLAPGRFGRVDPYDPAFRARCAAARSGKVAG